MPTVRRSEIAGMIDHALLKPTMTKQDIIDGCKLADQYKVAAVCVRPSDVVLAKEILKDSSVAVTTVIGFPHGMTTTECKVFEAVQAIENGCAELDVVINIGAHKSGDYTFVRQDLKAVIDAAHEKNVIVKVIFENCYLTEDEIIKACEICNEVGADFVKTSTGCGTGGAEDKDLIIMRKYAKPEIQVKASGGVKTLERVVRFKALGVTRCGCTATADILGQLQD